MSFDFNIIRNTDVLKLRDTFINYNSFVERESRYR